MQQQDESATRPEHHMRRAIELARHSSRSGGGPFGAVVVCDGRVVGEGSNEVVPGQDPTAHAEVVAIRKACVALGTHVLDRCTLYSSCEPCPMCLAAIHWARIPTVYHAADRHDAADAGFDDALLYERLCAKTPTRGRQLLADEARAVFAAWKADPERQMY